MLDAKTLVFHCRQKYNAKQKPALMQRVPAKHEAGCPIGCDIATFPPPRKQLRPHHMASKKAKVGGMEGILQAG